MGEHQVSGAAGGDALRVFAQRLLTDLRALEHMLAEGLVESDVRRLGAEQEVFLVDRAWRPAPVALEVLERLDDPRFTTELGRFNLEFNLDPIALGGDCLRRMEEQLVSLLTRLSEAAAACGARVVLTGILPTLDKSDLHLENMTPNPRYFALNEAMNRLRGEHYHFRIKGRDELIVKHDNVMLESCNTAFQVHFQVAPDQFAQRYNAAQAVAAPVLAAATNAPLLFGKCLWRETRIALFQQSVDTRTPTAHMREQWARVSFGRRWVRDSVLEIFRDDITRFRVLLSSELDEDPFAELERGNAPELGALRLHNSTVYRWNRPCYGISQGRPHLRIENRVLPSGPTVLDEMANAAFWFGLVNGVTDAFDDITRVMEFETARENFVAAARLGLGAQLLWPGRGSVPAPALILGELLEMSRHGLHNLGVAASDSERYLGVIEERVRVGRTGAQWLIDSLAGMKERGTRAERLAALVAATHRRQQKGEPAARWSLAELEEAGGWSSHYLQVGQLMTTDLFTVNQDELVDLVAYMMNWQHIRHVPVEDNQHRLVGLVTHRSLLRLVAQNRDTEQPIPVSDVMQRELITVHPETTTLEAIRLMRKHKISCLPVVQEDGRLVGIISERDFMGIAGRLLEAFLQDEEPTSVPLQDDDDSG